jgi:hypothetical protein
MLSVAKDLGPIVGFVSFAVFIVLAGLYIRKMREIRQLRRDAPFLAGRNGHRR